MCTADSKSLRRGGVSGWSFGRSKLQILFQRVILCLSCLVLVCRGRYGLGGVVLLFSSFFSSFWDRIWVESFTQGFEFGWSLSILGSNLGGVGPERGLRGGGRRGWCEEWARSG
jgi:hypothetical protein